MVSKSNSGSTGDIVRWWGPPSVALGAGLWGLESLFRVRLQQYFSSDLLVFYEHVMGAIVLAPVLWFARHQMRALTRKAIGWLLVSGIVGSAFGTVLFTAALNYMNVSVATLLLNLQPVIAVTMAFLLLKEKLANGFGKWAFLAVLAGAVITFDRFETLQVESPLGLICIFGAIFCWGTSTVAGRGMMRETTIFVAAPLRFAVGMIATLGVVFVNGNGPVVLERAAVIQRAEVFEQYLLLLLVAGITPTFLYFFGLKYTRATAGAFCEMIQAIVAVVVAWVVLGDALAWHQVLAGLALLASVVKINLLQASR